MTHTEHHLSFAPTADLDQARLDITARSRTSRLPWRGQFSPELVEYLMDAVCPDARVYYDPFCGSGTVLYEALQKSKSAIGSEVNPAAWHLASLASFMHLSQADRDLVVSSLRSVAADVASRPSVADAFPIVASYIASKAGHPFLALAISAAIIVGMGNSQVLDSSALGRGLFSVLSILTEAAPYKGEARCLLADARATSLPTESVDAVITSPPYINVFNYHQNNRLAVELLGWHPLQAAVSEIGANRKHRQNRFLTVIQYAMDMGECLVETARLVRLGGKLVIVLGRTSNVLGASFMNGRIVAQAIGSTSAFDGLVRAERSFVNRFGERIFEDILIASRNEVPASLDLPTLRSIGVAELERAKRIVPEKNLAALCDALEAAEAVKLSPRLAVSVPEAFKKHVNESSEDHGSRTYSSTRG
jgi:DNA modification methylase